MSAEDVLIQAEKMYVKTEGKLLEAATAIKIIKKKWPEKYGDNISEETLGFTWADMQTKVQEKIDSLLAKKKRAEEEEASKKKAEAAEDDDDSDDSDDDDDSDDEDEEEDDEEEDEDEEEEDMSDTASSTNESAAVEHDRPDAEDQPPTKKQRNDEEGNATATAAATESGDIQEKCNSMYTFLKKIRLSVPKRDGEPWEQYLKDSLLPLFEKNKLDPNKLDKQAAKRYNLMKELADLQADGERYGASADLDPKARVGRAGWGGYEAQKTGGGPKMPNQPSFIDDDE